MGTKAVSLGLFRGFRAALLAAVAALLIMAAITGAYLLLDRNSEMDQCVNGTRYEREVPAPTYDGTCAYLVRTHQR